MALRVRYRLGKGDGSLNSKEFAVLLPDTRTDGAMKVADELRRTVEDSPFEHRGRTIGMTISGGVAGPGPDGSDWEELYRNVDARLYEAKAAGRNRMMGGVGVPGPGYHVGTAESPVA